MSRTDPRKQREDRFNRMIGDGMRELLDSPNGRAFVWSFYADNVRAEGPGSKGRRAVAHDLMRLATHSHWPGTQLMRDEWEQPDLSVPPPREDDE